MKVRVVVIRRRLSKQKKYKMISTRNIGTDVLASKYSSDKAKTNK